MNLRQASPVTICIPSNRPLALARGPLESAIRFAGARNYRVVISDNSGEGAKFAHFANVPDHVTYFPSATPSAIKNMVACIGAADTEFVLMMGDDDYVEAVGDQPAFDFTGIGADIAGVRPLTEVFAIGEGALQISTFTIDAETAAERMYEYCQKVEGNNTLYYSYFRRADFSELANLLTEHPIVIGDMDWVFVYSLLSNGKVLHDGSTHFRYDIGRWRWREGIDASIEALYQAAGLPRQAIAFAHLFRFMNSYVFAFRRTSRLSEIERIKLLYAYAVILLGHTLHIADAEPGKVIGMEREIAMLRAALKEPDDYLINIFEVCARIAERLKPGLYERYINWFASVQRQDETD